MPSSPSRFRSFRRHLTVANITAALFSIALIVGAFLSKTSEDRLPMLWLVGVPFGLYVIWATARAFRLDRRSASRERLVRVPVGVGWSKSGWNLTALVHGEPGALAAIDAALRDLASDAKAVVALDIIGGRLSAQLALRPGLYKLFKRMEAIGKVIDLMQWGPPQPIVETAVARISDRSRPAAEREALLAALALEQRDHRLMTGLIQTLMLDPEPRLARAAAVLRGDPRAVGRIDAKVRRTEGGLALASEGGELALAGTAERTLEEVSPSTPGRA